jgi:hypothetical protein
VWFLGLLFFWIAKKIVYPPVHWLLDVLIGSSIKKIGKAPIDVRKDIFRNFGYGIMFSGGFGVVFLLLSVLITGTGTASGFTVSILATFSVILVIIALKIVASSI